MPMQLLNGRRAFAAAALVATLGLAGPALASQVVLSCSYPGSGFDHARVVLDYTRQTVSVYSNGDSFLARTFKTIVAPSIVEDDHVTHRAAFTDDTVTWQTVGTKWLGGDALAPVTDGAYEVVLDRKTGVFTVTWGSEKVLNTSANGSGLCIRRGETNLF